MSSSRERLGYFRRRVFRIAFVWRTIGSDRMDGARTVADGRRNLSFSRCGAVEVDRIDAFAQYCAADQTAVVVERGLLHRRGNVYLGHRGTACAECRQLDR